VEDRRAEERSMSASGVLARSGGETIGSFGKEVEGSFGGEGVLAGSEEPNRDGIVNPDLVPAVEPLS